MTAFDDLTWQEAMRHGHTALIESESLYADINASEGRSNLDIEKHLRRAKASATATQGPERGGTMLAWPPLLNPSASGTSTPSRSRPTIATRPPLPPGLAISERNSGRSAIGSVGAPAWTRCLGVGR